MVWALEEMKPVCPDQFQLPLGPGVVADGGAMPGSWVPLGTEVVFRVPTSNGASGITGVPVSVFERFNWSSMVWVMPETIWLLMSPVWVPLRGSDPKFPTDLTEL